MFWFPSQYGNVTETACADSRYQALSLNRTRDKAKTHMCINIFIKIVKHI